MSAEVSFDQYMHPLPTALSAEEKEEQDHLVAEIQTLKKEKNALILSHNYQLPEIHRVTDIAGDSYGLAVAAKKSKADIIVFCGVRFMAETAHMLNPDKKVLLPEEMAGCALADEITADQVRQWKQNNPDAQVVMYINSSADVKAEVDAICTSSNALHIVDSMESDTILFGPDANLAHVVMQKTKKKVFPWSGCCPVHKAVTKEMLEGTLSLHPDAVVLVHPECNPDVIELADEVLSTSQMLDVLAKRPEKKFVIGTEIGLIQQAQKQFPEKEIHPIYQHKSCDESCACPYMKITNLKSVKRSLETETHLITLPEDVRQKALKSVEKMLELGLPKTNS